LSKHIAVAVVVDDPVVVAVVPLQILHSLSHPCSHEQTCSFVQQALSLVKL